jgi:hypothetical protein
VNVIGGFSLCGVCESLIENRKGIWWATKDDTAVSAEVELHKHFPATTVGYHSHKYGEDIRTEILSVMGDFGFNTESLGEAETFGYYELFEDLCAIVEYDSQGFVFSTIYDTPEMARNAWSHIETDYDEWLEDEPCNCGSYNCDAYADRTEYEPDIFDYAMQTMENDLFR